MLNNVKTWIYGLRSNAKDFPTCSVAKIAAAKDDRGCPKGALVAKGPVELASSAPARTGAGHAPATPTYTSGTAAGQALVLLHQRRHARVRGLHTGASAPYPGTVRQQGKYLVTNVPLPPDISTNAGGLGLYAR